MRTPGGYAISTGPTGTVEHDTFTCGHCNQLVVVPHRCDPAELGGLCKLCMKLTCSRCLAEGVCDVFEKKLERMEARDRLLRSV